MLDALRPRSSSTSSHPRTIPERPARLRRGAVVSSLPDNSSLWTRDTLRPRTADNTLGAGRTPEMTLSHKDWRSAPTASRAVEFISSPSRPPRKLSRPKSAQRPSTASGVLEKKSSWALPAYTNMPSPPTVAHLTSTFKSKAVEATRAVRQSAKTKFSTADRTILEELRHSITARESQFFLRGGKKHHPYPAKEVPYPRSYERIVVDHDVWEVGFCQSLCKSITWHNFDTPPAKVLEIGCGTGAWIMNCARVWKQSHFVGLDIVPLHPDLQRVGSSELASRITWIQANFLEGLPFPNEEFDFVHIMRIARGVPEDKWDALLEEILRVMKPGAAIEVIEEDLYFPGSPADPLLFSSDNQPTSSAPPTPTHVAFPSMVNLSLNRDRQAPMESPTPPAGALSEADINLAKTHHTPGTPAKLKMPPARPQPTHFKSATPNPSPTKTRRTIFPVRKSSLPALPSRAPAVRKNSEISRAIETTYFSGVRGLGGGAGGTSSFSLPLSPPPPPSSSSFSVSGDKMSYDQQRASPLSQECTACPCDQAAWRVMYHPTPMQSADPRDHSVLELIYREMHAERFINLSPLALLTNLLALYFKDVRSHAPISFAFPPACSNQPSGIYDSEDESGPYDEDSDTDYIARRNRCRRRSSVVNREQIMLATQPFIIIDNSRAPAMSRASMMPRSSQHQNQQGDEQRASGRVSDWEFSSSQQPTVALPVDSLSPVVPVVAYTRPKHKNTGQSTNSLPNKTLAFDLKSLNLHLSARVHETLACAETMWEWVSSYQTKCRKQPQLQSDEERVDPCWKAVREMTRAEFDASLTRYELDMHQKTALGAALVQHLSWGIVPSARSQEHRNFDAACGRWEKRSGLSTPTESTSATASAGARSRSGSGSSLDAGVLESGMLSSEEGSTSASTGATSSGNGNGAHLQPHTPPTPTPPLRLSRTFRVFAAWKA